MTHGALEFGYPWWLTWGHLLLFGIVLGAFGLAWFFGSRRSVLIALGLIAVWAGAASIVVARKLDLNGVPPLPTQNFLRADAGRVVDLGAGTGRSSIMVLAARPHVTLVASDLFGESFQQHFGPAGRPQDRLLANLQAAGVDARASIATADMRKLPFETASFDAAVSVYAMDHLGREGATQALAEAHRVIKPGGQLLLILINDDHWTRFAFGPLLAHGGTYGAAWWGDHAADAGFHVDETGTSPATMFFLLTAQGF